MRLYQTAKEADHAALRRLHGAIGRQGAEILFGIKSAKSKAKKKTEKKVKKKSRQ